MKTDSLKHVAEVENLSALLRTGSISAGGAGATSTSPTPEGAGGVKRG